MSFCDICHQILNERNITCAECNYQICLICFAKGAESGVHVNNHAYVIAHKNVKIFPNSTWSAQQEQSLLELINTYGFNNWADISRAIKSHSPDECRSHYIQNYFSGIFSNPCGISENPYIRNVVPYLYKSFSRDPPRKVDPVHFDTPFDVSAETIITDLITDWGDEYQGIGEKLNCALINTYNHRVRERHRRHKIVRQHGLITPNRIKSWITKFYKAISSKELFESPSSSGKFISLMQLTTGVGFDRMIESFLYENDLRKFLNKLYELRAKGIQTYYSGRKFHFEKSFRTTKTNEKYALQWEWKHLLANKKTLSGTEQMLKHCMDLKQLPKKRKSTPLNIIGLSNYEKLNKEERELCSLIRLTPDSYLQAKKLLISENFKMGYLRLADARRLMKIDVNKTRVMYDFFIEHGFINSKSFIANIK